MLFMACLFKGCFKKQDCKIRKVFPFVCCNAKTAQAKLVYFSTFIQKAEMLQQFQMQRVTDYCIKLDCS